MDSPIVIFVAVVTIISLVIAALLLVLFVQRRRQHALLMLAIAQEEAERRRRKRRKAGLRRWEIDAVCPEALVSRVSEGDASFAMLSAERQPAEYWQAVKEIRAKEGGESSSGTLAEVIEMGRGSMVEVPPRAFRGSREYVVEGESGDVGGMVGDDGSDVGACCVTKSSQQGVTSAAPSEQGEEVPKFVIVLPVGQETCVICLDDIDVGTRVRCLPCRHVYHSQCIRVWLRRKNACPCCCVKVVKRRKKKRPRPVEELFNSPEDELGDEVEAHDAVPPSRSASLRSAIGEASQHRASISSEDALLPSAVRVSPPDSRPADRTEDVVVNLEEPRSKQLSYFNDRGRSSGISSLQSLYPRESSLVDSEDGNSEFVASETSSHFDEPTAAELLYQVRRALRGHPSLLSLGTSADGSEGVVGDQLCLPDVRLNENAEPFFRQRRTAG